MYNNCITITVKETCLFHALFYETIYLLKLFSFSNDEMHMKFLFLLTGLFIQLISVFWSWNKVREVGKGDFCERINKPSPYRPFVLDDFDYVVILVIGDDGNR